MKDSSYKYQYNGNCLLECPQWNINTNCICIDKDLCTISVKDINYQFIIIIFPLFFQNNRLLKIYILNQNNSPLHCIFKDFRWM